MKYLAFFFPEITDILTTDACKNSGKQLVCEPGRILRIIDVTCLPHNYTCPEKPRILSICDGQNSCGTVGLKDQIWSYCKGFTLKQMIISYRCVRGLYQIILIDIFYIQVSFSICYFPSFGIKSKLQLFQLFNWLAPALFPKASLHYSCNRIYCSNHIQLANLYHWIVIPVTYLLTNQYTFNANNFLMYICIKQTYALWSRLKVNK